MHYFFQHCKSRHGVTVFRTFSNSAKVSRYDGVDLRSGREVISSISTTFVLDPTEALLQGNGSQYLDEMLQTWKSKPDSVHPSWRKYFEGTSSRKMPLTRYNLPGSIMSPQVEDIDTAKISDAVQPAKVLKLIESYQAFGHFSANDNPLQSTKSKFRPAELSLSYHGLQDTDLDTKLHLRAGVLFPNSAEHSLREIINHCELTYCGSYGVEYKHISDHTGREWISQQIQARPVSIPQSEKQRILHELMLATTFEEFLSTKFPHDKRYGLDGAEGLAPTIATIIDYAAENFGTEKIVVGSCHRGRMTMLPCVWKKPMQAIFTEFRGGTACDPASGLVGDVKYHLGQEGIRRTNSGKDVEVSLLPNPSHLEVITAVAAGKAYATQASSKDPSKVLSLALHGDAAFAGQGVVYETLGLSKLPAYNVGGTIRVMVNNQIGFTTDKDSARSSHHCTDIAKYLDVPIFHVNGDDVETLCWISRMAVEWQATFRSDFIIDVVCYRKYGHNEIDQPSLTQPLMYNKIAELESPLDQYTKKLVSEGSWNASELEEQKLSIWNGISQEFAKAQTSTASKEEEVEHVSLLNPDLQSKPQQSAKTAHSESLSRVMNHLSTIPSCFNVHRTVKRVLEARKTAFAEGTVDWSTAEALAFGTILKQGYNVRLTGQDVQRGTFSQRHVVLHDQKTGEKYIPLQNLDIDNDNARLGKFLAANSPLGEYATLAFEYGHTLANSDTLTMWEAQFGDFANTAQVVIDNLIAPGRSKWQQQSKIVLSLPHGYDGQGAEHSSARMERFLLLCNEDGLVWPESTNDQRQNCNIQVVYPTTPANYFHLLRRQMWSEHRRPLVILFSKSLLRHPLTRSSISDLESNNSDFQTVLCDEQADNEPNLISRVILCTGQIYAALHAHQQKATIREAAIVRIEELHPFPFEALKDCLEKFSNLQEIVWAQEEPYNGGAWHYVRDRLETVLRQCGLSFKVRCVSRPVSAATAVGSKKVSDQELTSVLETCFSQY